MLATMNACPDENALVRFSSGQLSGQDLGPIERHLDTCSGCRTLVAQLSSAPRVTWAPGSDAPMRERHGSIGRYQVERLVGGGAMGMVYAARDRELNRAVAIKLLRTTGPSSSEPRARLLREAQTMAKLSHPNVVPIFELGADEGDDYLAMELIDGPTLDQWLREKKRDWREVVKVFIEAGRGLEAAHQAGVVHRDFKPNNVLIGPDGRARVTDFGLSRPDVSLSGALADAGSVDLTREGTLLGTPAYMSPEQLEGNVADVRSDQFNFCVALTESLVGHRPFPGRTLEDLRNAMRSGKPPAFEVPSSRLKRALLKGMSIAPAHRFASMGGLLDELQVVLKPTRPTRNDLMIATGVLVVLSVATGLGWDNFQFRRVRARAPAAAIEAIPALKEVTLMVGEERPFALKGVQEIISLNASQLKATLVGNQQVRLVGVSPGVSTLALKIRAGPHDPRVTVEWQVTVKPAAQRKALSLKKGAQQVLTVSGIQRVAVGDSDIADLKAIGNDQLLVIGAGEGTTTVIVWTSVSERLEWDVTVSR